MRGEELLGQVIANDRYALVELIGQEHFAEVFRARDELLERSVVIKLFYPDLLPDEIRDELVECFVDEVKAVSRFHHAHICPVFDFGQQDDFYYVVMMCVEGRAPYDYITQCRDGRDYLKFVVEVARAIGEALDYAHSNDILHRNIKPSNILITDEDDILLPGFGLAWFPETSDLITHTGTFLGSWAHAAPEQIAGGKVTERCDIYSLGATLYEILTGKVPFKHNAEGDNARGVQKGQPVPPSILRGGLSEEVDRVIARALETDPARRFQTGSELAEALRVAVEGRSSAERRAKVSGWMMGPLYAEETEVREALAKLGEGTEREKLSRWVAIGVIALMLVALLFVVIGLAIWQRAPAPWTGKIVVSFDRDCPQWQSTSKACDTRCEGGKYVVSLAPGVSASLSVLPDRVCADFDASVEIESSQPEVMVGLVFWASDSIYHIFEVQPSAQRATLREVGGQQGTLKVIEGLKGIDPAQDTITLRVRAVDGRVTGYINDSVVFDEIELEGQGHLRLAAGAPAGVVKIRFDNFTVRTGILEANP